MFLSVHQLTLSTNYILQAAAPLLCISAVGWLVYLVGLCLIQSSTSDDLSSSSSATVITTPLWLFLASGVPLYILNLVYLLTGNSVVGLAANLFNIVFLVGGGIAVWSTGATLAILNREFSYYSSQSLTQSPGYSYIATTFAGSLIAMLFQGISMLLWPFFIINTPDCCMSLTEEDRMAFDRRNQQQPQQPQQIGYTMQQAYFVPPMSGQMMPVAAVPTSYQPVGEEIKS